MLPNLKTKEVLRAADAKTHEQGTDAPGRSINSVGARRSAMEQTDWHDQAEQRFLADLGEASRCRGDGRRDQVTDHRRAAARARRAAAGLFERAARAPCRPRSTRTTSRCRCTRSRSIWQRNCHCETAGKPRDRFWIASLRSQDGLAFAAQRLIEIVEQIVHILDPDREPQQIGRAGRARALDRGAMLDQALDAAERGRALPQLDARGGLDRRRARRPSPGSTACRRSRRHLALRDVVAGMLRQARDRAPRRPAGARRSAAPVRRRALGRCAHAHIAACAGRASAATPRTARGSRRAARARCRSASQNSSARAVASAPAITSEWPLRYLVAECMTMSAPSASGRVNSGVADGRVDAERWRRPRERSRRRPRCR